MLKKSSLGILLIIISILLPLTEFTIIRAKEKEVKITTLKNEETENYYAILEIPKINLKKEIYAKDDENNNLDLCQVLGHNFLHIFKSVFKFIPISSR